ncbi:hypothetical protein BHE74_00012484 [Ensete ventricosum]|nr:hypothetical protein BHE74_00012484 [Ensete ventricosum]RZR86253.1 hypothetical protein BHM03_00013413 [Ensete ventricosum]
MLSSIEKIVLFFLEQQGILACRIQELDEQQTKLLEHPDISEISELREAYAATGHDLLRLLRFLDLNAADLQEHQGSYLSIYDQPSTALTV